MVKEIDLTDNEGVKKKPELASEDVRPNFSKEILERGYVEFPVYRNVTIPFLGMKGKFCDYEIKRYGVGNLAEITQKFGALEVNPQDERYLRPNSDMLTIRTYCFYYSYNEKRFKQESNAERWRGMVNEAKHQRQDKYVIDLMWKFIDFYEGFWIKRLHFCKIRSLTACPTFLECMSYMYYLGCQCQEMRSFFAMLYAFGELSEEEYRFLILSLDHHEREVVSFHDYLNGQAYEQSLKPQEIEYDDAKHGKRLEKFERFIEKFFKPAYFTDPDKEIMFPEYWTAL